jgi:hypothetical protein
MSNFHLKLLLEKMDWNSADINSEFTHLKSYKVNNITLTEERIDDLHLEIVQAKGDWLNFNYDVIGENHYVTVNIIFHSMDLNHEDERIVNKVLEKCDLFLQDLKPEKATLNNPTNFELLDYIIDEDGFVIKAHEPGGWGVAEALTKLLTSYNIPFRTIRQQKSRFDGGASGGHEEIILFIGGSVSSGLTWDVLKGILTSRFGNSLENFRTSFVDNLRFKKLRRTIADRIVEDYKDLVLIDLFKQESEIICEFKVYGIIEKTITVLCDSEYEIKELKLERVPLPNIAVKEQDA